MKIYLKTGTEWKLFEADNLSAEFKLRNIIIGEWARIGARASIGEGARIGARARIETTMDCIVMGPLGSENRMLTFYLGKESLRASTGCFDGTPDEFLKAVKSKHGDNRIGREYLAALKYAKAKFAIK